VPLPNPELGLIVNYSYSFHRRTKVIGDAGKNRPCLIAAVFPDRQEPLRTGILYLPITHTKPGPEDEGIALSIDARYAAGLDSARQWVLTSQGNQDTWPEDIFALPNKPGQFSYGFLPPSAFKAVQISLTALYAQRKFNIIRRSPL